MTHANCFHNICKQTLTKIVVATASFKEYPPLRLKLNCMNSKLDSEIVLSYCYCLTVSAGTIYSEAFNIHLSKSRQEGEERKASTVLF